MEISTEAFQYIAALLAGILILIQPKLLNYIVAIFLIAFGTMGVLQVFKII